MVIHLSMSLSACLHHYHPSDSRHAEETMAALAAWEEGEEGGREGETPGGRRAWKPG